MSQKLPLKYVNEDAVKQALKIDSFRNISKEKIMQFVSMLPYMDKEVAIAVVNQFPVYVDFAKAAIDVYGQLNNKILESNKESQAAVVKGYQTVLDTLSSQLEKPDLNESERDSITKNMISVADKIQEADLENKKFLYKLANVVQVGIFSGLVAAGTGIGIAIHRGKLPKI